MFVLDAVGDDLDVMLKSLFPTPLNWRDELRARNIAVRDAPLLFEPMGDYKSKRKENSEMAQHSDAGCTGQQSVTDKFSFSL